MNVKELKAFRAKLVLAEIWEGEHAYRSEDSHVILALGRQDIRVSRDVEKFLFSIPSNECRKYVAALFANSIAAIDAQIKKGKS